jgi:hypothetical protein
MIPFSPRLYVEAPEGCSLQEGDVRSLELVRMDDVTLTEPVLASEIDPKNQDLDRDKVPEKLVKSKAWKVLPYWSEGSGKLYFRGKLQDGEPFQAKALVEIEIRKKEKKG